MYAAQLPGAIAVFETLGLDYACAGPRSLEDAAYAEGIEYMFLENCILFPRAAAFAEQGVQA